MLEPHTTLLTIQIEPSDCPFGHHDFVHHSTAEAIAGMQQLAPSGPIGVANVGRNFTPLSTNEATPNLGLIEKYR